MTNFETERVVGEFQDLIQRFRNLQDKTTFVPPDKPIPNRTIWCNGTEISLDLPKNEFLRRLQEATERRQQT